MDSKGHGDIIPCIMPWSRSQSLDANEILKYRERKMTNECLSSPGDSTWKSFSLNRNGAQGTDTLLEAHHA